MRTLLTILGILFVLAGVIWFLQGINLIPGSFMTGQTRWAINGIVAVLIGIGMLVFASWRRSSPPK